MASAPVVARLTAAVGYPGALMFLLSFNDLIAEVRYHS